MARKRGQLYLLGMYWAAMIRKPTAGSKKERFYPLVTRIQRYIAASTGSRMSAPKSDFLVLSFRAQEGCCSPSHHICISSRKKVEAWWRGEGEASLSSQQMLSPEGLQHVPASTHGLDNVKKEQRGWDEGWGRQPVLSASQTCPHFLLLCRAVGFFPCPHHILPS